MAAGYGEQAGLDSRDTKDLHVVSLRSNRLCISMQSVLNRAVFSLIAVNTGASGSV